jgi:hypothetical protein
MSTLEDVSSEKLDFQAFAFLKFKLYRYGEARMEQQRRMEVKNRGYSQRITDARNSMNRVKMLGATRKSRG